MNEKKFLQGLKYLNAYYTNFNFDINDNFKIGVWYESFKNMSEESFTKVVKGYCQQNVFAPHSPSHLLDHAKKVMIQNKKTPEEAWELAITILRETGYDFERTYKLTNNLITNCIKQMRSQLQGMLTKDVPFARKQFIELYKREVQQDVDKQTRKGLISYDYDTSKSKKNTLLSDSSLQKRLQDI